MHHTLRFTRKASAAATLAVLATGGTALGLGVTGAQADAHSAQSTSHTLTFSTHQLRDKIVHGVDLAVDKIVQNGAVTGFDTTSCRVDPATRVATCDVAMSRANGLLYAHIMFDVSTGQVRGKVTGGTRHFRGTSGTVSSSGSQITVRYTR